MHRPSTLEEVIAHPRKMKQRYVDNQCNNMRKKGEKGDYNRLRALVQASDELRAQAAQIVPGTSDLGDDDEDEDDAESPARATGKRRRVAVNPAVNRRKKQTPRVEVATPAEVGRVVQTRVVSVGNTPPQLSNPQYEDQKQYQSADVGNIDHHQLQEYVLDNGQVSGYGYFDPQLFQTMSEGFHQVRHNSTAPFRHTAEGFAVTSLSAQQHKTPSLAVQAQGMDVSELQAAVLDHGMTAEEFAIFDSILNFDSPVPPQAEQTHFLTPESMNDPLPHNDSGKSLGQAFGASLLGANDSGVADLGQTWDGQSYV